MNHKSKTARRIFNLPLLIFTLIVIIYNPTVDAQSFEKVNTINIGYPVTSLEFIENWNLDEQYNLLAIGAKNINYGRSGSAGWVDIRNPNNGNLIRHYNLNHFVNELSYFNDNDRDKLAVAVDRGAALIDINSGKITYVNSPYYNVLLSITFLENGLFATGDSEGGIVLYDTTETNGLLPVKKIIKHPIQNGSAIFSLANYSNKLIAGGLNHIVALDDSTWEQSYIIETPPTTNYVGRANLVVDVANSFVSADVDSISIYSINDGSQIARIASSDRPESITFGVYDIPMIAIGTSYDKTYVYNIENDNLVLLGNFSNHTNSVLSVAFGIIDRQDGKDVFAIATGSTDGTIEIWKYISSSN